MSYLLRKIRYYFYQLGLFSLSRFPWAGKELRLEASSKCQLKCPLCLTGTHYHRQHSSVGWGHLRHKDFEQFLKQNPQIRHIELSNYGEIFLNPDINAIIETAYQQGVTLSAINGVNLNHIREDTLEALVKFGFRKLKVSIDGASQESYQIYRVGGNFEQVIAHIKKINEWKAYYRSKYPLLKWQFIIFGHNEHELPLARQMAASLGMRFKAKLNYAPKKYPIKNPDFVKKESGLGVANIEEYERQQKKLYSPACLQLWTSPQVNWDGKLLGCCVNHFGDFGNVFEEGLPQLLQSERYVYAKQMLLGEKPARPDIPCTACNRYKRVLQMPFKKHLMEQLFKE